MQADELIEQTGVRAASGRLRFSVPSAGCQPPLRLMVLDASGSVVHRTRVHSALTRTPVKLTGFPRGEVFLVCVFADDELIWSAPVQAG